MSAPTTDTGFCRMLSSEVDEPIAASAVSDTWLWIVIEYGGPWGAKAYEEAALPEAVRAAVDGWVARNPGARVQLVRRRTTKEGEVQVFLAWTRPEHRAVRRFRLASMNEVASLDVFAFVDAMQRGQDPATGEPLEHPLVMVCTNGRRDRCCAKWGVPVYRELSRRDDLEVWQTTHLGGHRFAATLLTLPEGACYGRISTDELDTFTQAVHEGHIHRIDRFRGRTCHPSAAQAAEHFFHEKHTGSRIDTIRKITLEPVANGTLARLFDRRGVEHRLVVTRDVLSRTAPPSCGKAPEAILRWRLVE